jgi:hypothetical protein
MAGDHTRADARRARTRRRVRTVEFGAGDDWTSKTLTSATPCTDAVFTDPDFGVVESCFLEL